MPSILVACEFSQTVLSAFLAKGFDGYSCDLLPCEGAFPEKHIMGDAIEVLYSMHFDLVIAHPPCTYLTRAAACHFHRYGAWDINRYYNMIASRDFFYKFYKYEKCPICIENPIPMSVCKLPQYSQIIDPTDFGATHSKATCLWLKGLPILLPTTTRPLSPKSYVFSTRGGHNRSKFNPLFAQAMADQWSPIFL